MQDVVITGIGVLGPHGVGVERIAAAARARQRPFAAWPAAAHPPHAEALIAQVGDYPKARYFNDRQLRMMDKAMCLSAFAAGTALESAGWADGQAPGETATLLGTMRAEQPSVHKFLQPLLQGRPERINPAEFPQIARNIACGQLAIRFGLRGPSTVLASGPLAGLEALARAADFVAAGRCQVALAGGLDVLSRFSLYVGRHLYGDCMQAACPRFFGTETGYLVPSEGACLLVVESAAHAAQRGARPLARLRGWSAGRAAGQALEPALARGWQRLLSAAQREPADVGVVAAGAGGGNRPHEQAETNALAAWLAGSDTPARVSAPCAWVGEGEAWTGALLAAMAVQALTSGDVPPTAGVCAEAPAPLAERAAGGAVAAPCALVTATESHGAWISLLLEQP